jgi:hypothetical protein
MRRILVLTLCLGAAGCTAPIKMRNAATGATAACGPYFVTTNTVAVQTVREIQCIQDFQRQGFERAAE